MFMDFMEVITTNTFASFHSLNDKSFYCNSTLIGTWYAVIQEVQTDVYIKLNSFRLQRIPINVVKLKECKLKN